MNTRRFHMFCRSLVLVIPLIAAESPAADGPPRAALGINLAGPADWNTELPFIDVFRLSRAWISQKSGAGWGNGPSLDLDERGWVKRLEDGCLAETPLCTIDGGHYPSGDWTVLWDGEGKIYVEANAMPQSIRWMEDNRKIAKQYGLKYFAAWEANEGDLLCHFSSVGRWSKWGSWGLLQHSDDDPTQSPKFVSTMKWAKKLGQPVYVP